MDVLDNFPSTLTPQIYLNQYPNEVDKEIGWYVFYSSSNL